MAQIFSPIMPDWMKSGNTNFLSSLLLVIIMQLFLHNMWCQHLSHIVSIFSKPVENNHPFNINDLPLLISLISNPQITVHTSWLVSTRLQLCCSLCWMKASSVENSDWQRPHLCTSSSDNTKTCTLQNETTSLSVWAPRYHRADVNVSEHCWLAALLIWVKLIPS